MRRNTLITNLVPFQVLTLPRDRGQVRASLEQWRRELGRRLVEMGRRRGRSRGLNSRIPRNDPQKGVTWKEHLSPWGLALLVSPMQQRLQCLGPSFPRGMGWRASRGRKTLLVPKEFLRPPPREKWLKSQGTKRPVRRSPRRLRCPHHPPGLSKVMQEGLQ
jgi:hypothetical protein